MIYMQNMPALRGKPFLTYANFASQQLINISQSLDGAAG